MEALRKMNIKTRLMLVVMFLIILVASVTTLEFFMTRNILSAQQEATQTITREIEHAITMKNNFHALLLNLNGSSNQNTQSVNQFFTSYSNSLNEYRRLALSSGYNPLNIGFFDNLSSNFTEFQQLYTLFMQEGMYTGTTEQFRLIQLGNSISGDISTLIQTSNTSLISVNNSFYENLIFLSGMQNIIYVVSFIMLIIFLSITARSIINPIEDLEQLMNKVTDGDIDISIDMDCNDEIGRLSKSISEAISQFKGVADEIKTVSDEIIKQNNTKLRLNKNSYKGEFASIVLAYNNTVEKLTSENKAVEDSINNLSKGEFNLNFERRTNSDTNISKSLQELKNNLGNTSKEIKNLLNSAINGKFDVQSNANNYSGAWREIILCLHTLINDNKSRVDGAVSALAEFEKGNYNQNMNVFGNFEGDYKKVKNALERTNSAMYIRINEISKANTVTTSASRIPAPTTVSSNRMTSTFAKASATVAKRAPISKRDTDSNNEVSFSARKDSSKNEPYIDFSQRGFGKY